MKRDPNSRKKKNRENPPKNLTTKPTKYTMYGRTEEVCLLFNLPAKGASFELSHRTSEVPV